MTGGDGDELLKAVMVLQAEVLWNTDLFAELIRRSTETMIAEGARAEEEVKELVGQLLGSLRRQPYWRGTLALFEATLMFLGDFICASTEENGPHPADRAAVAAKLDPGLWAKLMDLVSREGDED